MKNKKIRTIFTLLFISAICWQGDIVQAQIAKARANSDEYMECIKNGDFEGNTKWNSTGFMVVNPREDGGWAAKISMSGDAYGTIYQPLILPDSITEAIFSMDYRFEATTQYYFQMFAIGIYSGNPPQPLVTLGGINDISYLSSTWQKCQIHLQENLLAQIRQAQSQGLPLYFVVVLQAKYLTAVLDNISFKVKGRPRQVQVKGLIAYLENDEKSGCSRCIKTIQADGDNTQVVWKHPHSTVPKISSLAWKPDGRRLAFTSNHEADTSAFGLDIYTIKPDGTDIRRVTNSPSPKEIESGEYKMGRVCGKIYNGYGNVASFLLYIQGAKKPIMLRPYFKQTVDFFVDEVADLGIGVNQMIVFLWSNLFCSYGREFSGTFVDVVPGESVDVGTLQFLGRCNTYECHCLSWKRDGSEIAFSLGGIPQRTTVQGAWLGELFSHQSANDLAWSPVNDYILYYKYLGGHKTGIYLTQPGAGEGSWVVPGVVSSACQPSWLQDCSGFVYLDVSNLYLYNFASKQSMQLTNFNGDIEKAEYPSVSSDGKYVAFCKRMVSRQETGYKSPHDIFILDLGEPGRTWQITQDGRSCYPRWSPK